jgi:hypothetical protein
MRSLVPRVSIEGPPRMVGQELEVRYAESTSCLRCINRYITKNLRAAYAKLELGRYISRQIAAASQIPESERSMSTELLHLPSDIPVIQVQVSGFAASSNPETALQPTGLPECKRAACGLRGDRVPPLLGGFEAIRRATDIATELEEVEEWRGGHADQEALGHVFHVSMSGGIAVPPSRLAVGMERGTAAEVWERLRPHAESDEFHGIDLPIGRIIFRDAQLSGHYHEKLMTSIPSMRPHMAPESGTTGKT